MSDNAKQIILFQQNLKKTELGVRFGKKILTDPGSLSPKQITGILQLLGAPIPRELEVLPDAAQAIVTGAAVINKASQANSIADLKDLVKPGVASLGTMTKLFREFGWMDNKTGTQLQVLGDAALIVASGGTDVSAWVRVAMSVGMESARADAEAQGLAQIRAYEKVSSEQRVQADRFIQNIHDLQAGRLGLFSFLAESVDELPLMFDSLITNNPAFAPLLSKFPNLKFLPKGTWTFEGVGTSETWYGDQRESKHYVSMPVIQKMSNESAFEFLFMNMIGPGALQYLKAREFYLSQGKADLVNAAIFNLFDPTYRAGDASNALDLFIKNQITPWEIGEDRAFEKSFVGSTNAVTTNFGLIKKQESFTKEQIQYLDRTGNLSPLVNNRFTRDALKDHFTFPKHPGENFPMPGGYEWRDLSNLIAVMDAFDMVRADPKFSRILKESKLIAGFSFLPMIEDFKLVFQQAYEVSMIRRVNRAASANAAYFLGTTVDKLRPVTMNGGPTIFK